MRTVTLLEQAILAARQVGYEIRYEWMIGSSGGACEVAGKKLLFIDLAESSAEQLERVGQVLREDPDVSVVGLTPQLIRHFGLRRSA